MSRFYRRTVVWMLLIAVLPVLILGSFAAWLSYTSIQSEIRRSSAIQLSRIQQTNEMIFDETRMTNIAISSVAEIAYLLNDIMCSGTASYNEWQTYDVLRAFLASQTVSRNYIHSIYIAFDNCEERIFSSTDGIVDTTVFNDTDWLSYLDSDTLGASFVLRTIPSTYEKKGQKVVTVLRPFTFGNKSVHGVIALNLSWQYMQELNESLSSESDGALVVFGDSILFDVGTNAGSWSDVLPELAAHKEGEFTCVSNGVSYVVSKQISEQYGLSYYLFERSDTLYAIPNSILKTISILAALLGGGGLLFAWFASRRLHRRIRRIMDMLPGSPDGTEISSGDYDEYEYIARQIQNDQLLKKYFEMQLTEKAYQQKSAEMVALQAQINPHMLFNTLEVIHWKVFGLTQEENDATVMLEKLSALLKYSLQPAGKLVTLEEEVDSTANYLTLLRLRYPEKLNIIWDYDDSLSGYACMRLILQPLIENAVSHGSMPDSQARTVKICISPFHGQIRVRIYNNGGGLNKEELAALRQRIASPTPPPRGIGLYNTNRRLCLQYGKGLRISSSPRLGFMVSFTFPAQSSDLPNGEEV